MSEEIPKYLTRTPLFVRQKETELIHEVVMPLFTVRNESEEFASGTAFLLGRGWAVTAYHVIEDFYRRYEEKLVPEQDCQLSFEILAYLTVDQGKKLLPLRVLRVWRSAPLDLAVLALGIPQDWPDDFRWKAPAIDLLPPKIGTQVVGFGFANPRLGQSSEGSVPTYSADPMMTTGEVQAIHHEIRDSARLPFPCFQTNARFDAGMSGGPIFNNQTGHVCGVICSSFPSNHDDENHVTYGSTIWPILGTMVDASERSPSGAAPYPLLNLFQNATLKANNLENIGLINDSKGLRRVVARYNQQLWDSPPTT